MFQLEMMASSSVCISSSSFYNIMTFLITAYADDTLIYPELSPMTVVQSSPLFQCFEEVNNFLQLNKEKTGAMFFGNRKG